MKTNSIQNDINSMGTFFVLLNNQLRLNNSLYSESYKKKHNSLKKLKGIETRVVWGYAERFFIKPYASA